MPVLTSTPWATSSFRRSRRRSALVAAVALVAACGGDGSDEKGTAEFVTPNDGDEVTSPVRIEMSSEGLTIEPAGEVNDRAGHYHVLVDVGCLERGREIPDTDGYYHFGDGEDSGSVELDPGEHELCLQLGDGAHIAAPITDEITITVSD